MVDREAKLIKIVNSKGVRLPKAIRIQTGMTKPIEIEARGITLSSSQSKNHAADGKRALPKVVVIWPNKTMHGWMLILSLAKVIVGEAQRSLLGQSRSNGGQRSEKRRPAVILSLDEMNRSLPVVIVAPITSSKKSWPTRADITLSGKVGPIMLDQIRTVDKPRLMKHIAEVEIVKALDALQIILSSGAHQHSIKHCISDSFCNRQPE